MNKDIFEGNMKILQGNIKKQWGKLTDDDFKEMEGSFDKLSGILQKRYGYNKDVAKKEIDLFTKNHKLDSHGQQLHQKDFEQSNKKKAA